MLDGNLHYRPRDALVAIARFHRDITNQIPVEASLVLANGDIGDDASIFDPDKTGHVLWKDRRVAHRPENNSYLA